jgi:tetratricopeptide (TPR) repeat protein
MISENAPTLDDLDKAISLDPNFPLSYLERAIYWLNNESPNKALEDLNTALELMPDSALVHYKIAQAHLANGDIEEALAAAEKANEIDLTMLPVYFLLGKIYFENGQYDEALGALQTYNLYVEDDPDGLYMLGAIYNMQGNYAASLQALNSAVEQGNKTAQVYYQRGIAYLNLSELDLAEKDFNRSLGLGRIDHDYYPALGLAWVEYAKGKYGNTYMQVQQQVRPLAETDAQLAETNYWAARALEGMDRHDLAIRYWNELLALPDEVIKDEWRAEALQYLGTPTP